MKPTKERKENVMKLICIRKAESQEDLKEKRRWRVNSARWKKWNQQKKENETKLTYKPWLRERRKTARRKEWSTKEPGSKKKRRS
jgi:hypothetical protein